MYIVNGLNLSTLEIRTLYIIDNFNEASKYIEGIDTIDLNDLTINITATLNHIPNLDNADGYYIVRDLNNPNIFDIYEKKNEITKGYLWDDIRAISTKIYSFIITNYENYQQIRDEEISSTEDDKISETDYSIRESKSYDDIHFRRSHIKTKRTREYPYIDINYIKTRPNIFSLYSNSNLDNEKKLLYNSLVNEIKNLHHANLTYAM
jgi:hypothetical protein